MVLLVDMGNSRIKWCRWQDGAMGPVSAHHYSDSGLYEKIWSQLPPPESLALSCVAGSQRLQELQGWVSEHWGCAIDLLRSTSETLGVVNGYRNPEQLGVDRWAAMVAAYHLRGEAVMVVDCGTALTIDIITGDGHHRGGMIVPGPGSMRASLLQRTARLGSLPQGTKVVELGDSTETAVEAGIGMAVAALLQSTYQRWLSTLGGSMHVIITGGEALLCCHGMGDADMDWELEEDLVLQGVALLAGVGDWGCP